MNLLFFALTISLGVYILFVLFFLTGLRRIKTSENNFTDWPTVAIVIAARNEEENLTHILEDLTHLDYPNELLDVVISDDRSTDNSWSVIQHYSEQYEYIHGVQINEDVNHIPIKLLEIDHDSNDKVVVYPHELKITQSGTEATVRKSYFKGEVFLVEISAGNRSILIDHHEELIAGEKICFKVKDGVLEGRIK